MSLQDIKIRSKDKSVVKKSIVRDDLSGVVKLFSEHGRTNVIVQTVGYSRLIEAKIISDNLENVVKQKTMADFSSVTIDENTGICSFDFLLTTTSQNHGCTSFYLLVSYVNNKDQTIYVASMPLISYSKYNIKTTQSNLEMYSFVSTHTFQSASQSCANFSSEGLISLLTSEFQRDSLCYYVVQMNHRDTKCAYKPAQFVIDAIRDITATDCEGIFIWQPERYFTSSYQSITWLYQSWILFGCNHNILSTITTTRSCANEWIAIHSCIKMFSLSSARSQGQLTKRKRKNCITSEVECNLEAELCR
jgi:hypothetical protein